MKCILDKTGGYVAMDESFNSDMFKNTFKKLFEKDSNGDMKMGYCARLDYYCSKDLKVCGAIGPCTSLKKGTPIVSETEIG